MSLNDIYLQYQADRAFQSLRDFGSRFVPGTGTSHMPPIMFIGEAPGVMEDIQGVPFVGRAGIKLNDFLLEVHILREDCWTSNIVKYRPPDNRYPSISEIAASTPYLLQEINEVNPLVVCPLGRCSMNVLLPNVTSITKASGKKFDSPLIKMPVVPIIHPGRVLRPGAESASIIIRASFQKVKELIDGAAEEVS